METCKLGLYPAGTSLFRPRSQAPDKLKLALQQMMTMSERVAKHTRWSVAESALYTASLQQTDQPNKPIYSDATLALPAQLQNICVL